VGPISPPSKHQANRRLRHGCHSIERILDHIGEPAEPPRISPARGPPAWEDAPEPMPDWDLLGQPEPGVALDQRIAW
jgi:hypothetical protein